MQALESLNDAQVNDFLSGKSPLNLSVRLGDHMMLIQLQLSTLSQSQQNFLKQKISNSNLKQSASGSSRRLQPQTLETAAPIKKLKQSSSACSTITKTLTETTTAMDLSESSASTSSTASAIPTTSNTNAMETEQSPIKSLSNLVSGPIKTASQNFDLNDRLGKIFSAVQTTSQQTNPPPQTIVETAADTCTDPISANLTSCLCKRLNTNCNNNCDQKSSTPTFKIPQSHSDSEAIPSTSAATSSTSSLSNRPPLSSCLTINRQKKRLFKRDVRLPEQPIEEPQAPLNTSIDSPALAEASRNLTQTLRRLSKRVFTNKINLSEENTRAPPSNSVSNSSAAASSPNSSGAVIESVKHHGKGIYSGTFSGTLNPALQDKYGRPKRDISTIIHILNDLLSASPQITKNSRARIYFDPYSGTSTSTTNTSTNSSSSTLTASVPSLAPSERHIKVRLGI